MEREPLVLFQGAGRGFSRRRVASFSGVLCDEVAGGRRFCVLVANDARLRRLNRDFLGHDYATDVLSFPAPGPDSLGDLAISRQRAEEQARERGHSLEAEIEVLMLHGVLHLLGYDHEADRGRMARAERKWREAFGLPAGLIERGGR